MMLHSSVILSLLVILSAFIDVRAVSDLREKRSRGCPEEFDEDCHEGGSCPNEGCSFQDACLSVPRNVPGAGRFPPRMNRHDEEEDPEFHDYDEPQMEERKQRWRSPVVARNPHLNSSGGQPNRGRIPIGIAVRCPPGIRPGQPFPHLQRFNDPNASRRVPDNFPNRNLPPQHRHLPPRNQQVHTMPNNVPPEWRQLHTSQDQPIGAHHGQHRRPSETQQNPLFRHPPCRQDVYQTTTPKPFFYDFMPKYVETVPPPNCPISPCYEPPPKIPCEVPGPQSGPQCAKINQPQNSFGPIHQIQPGFMRPKF